MAAEDGGNILAEDVDGNGPADFEIQLHGLASLFVANITLLRGSAVLDATALTADGLAWAQRPTPIFLGDDKRVTFDYKRWPVVHLARRQIFDAIALTERKICH